MKVRALSRFVLGDQVREPGEEFEIQPESASRWRRGGLVELVDGDWPTEALAATQEAEVQEGPEDGPCSACEPEARKDRKALQVCPSPMCSCLTPGSRGTHEPNNVQAAHFLCNSQKGDRVGDVSLAA